MSLAWVLFTAVIAAAVIGSGLLGRVEGYTRGQREALLSGLAGSLEVPDPDMCRCSHGRQCHISKGKGSCRVVLNVDQGLRCACTRFTVKRVPVKMPKGELDL